MSSSLYTVQVSKFILGMCVLAAALFSASAPAQAATDIHHNDVIVLTVDTEPAEQEPPVIEREITIGQRVFNVALVSLVVACACTAIYDEVQKRRKAARD